MTQAHQLEIDNRQNRFLLASIICQTEEMLQFAQQGQWQEVEFLDEKRKADMQVCFSVKDDDPLVTEAIATLIVLNDKISVLINQARQDLLIASSTHQEGKQAVNQYQENSL